MKRPSDGVHNSKLTPIENLVNSIIIQAVEDIKTTTWNDSPRAQSRCRTFEGLEAVDFLLMVFKQHGYSDNQITSMFKKIVPNNYKYDLIKKRLEKRGIEL